MGIGILNGTFAIFSLASTISFGKNEMPSPLVIRPLMVSM